ncbi:MAG: hypothetical protein K5744_07380 [Eubacterium sp.]|nr:hypothetical protein [Eubacterium sp.]
MRKRMKTLTAALCLGLVFSMMAGCTSSTASDRKPATKSESSESSDKDTKKKAEPTESLKEAKANSDKVAEALKKTEALKNKTDNGDQDGKDDKDGEDKPDTKKKSGGKVTVDEQVLLDQDGVKVTALEYTTGDYMGDGIKLRIENNTDKSLRLAADALIVNECMINSMLAVEVAPGKKANETMYLSKTDLEAAGITEVGQVEVYFRGYDEDTYDTIVKSDCVTIRTSAYDRMDTKVDDSGDEIYNANGIRIVCKSLGESNEFSSKILLYMENTSDKKVTISADDVSIDGTMTRAYMASEVYAGRRRFDGIMFLASNLEENNIEKIENVELKFKIYDTETYETIAETDTIKLLAK